MKSITNVKYLLVLITSTAACNNGALEHKHVTSYGTFFGCEDNPMHISDDDDEYDYEWWEEVTCADLGYTNQPSSGGTIFNAAGSNIPGKCGYWGDNSANCSGGSSPGGSDSFTCDIGNACAYYTGDSSSISSLKAQCGGTVSSGNNCGGFSECCRHTNNGVTVKTYTNNPSSDSECAATGGSSC